MERSRGCGNRSSYFRRHDGNRGHSGRSQKEKNLRPGSNFSGRPDLYADLRNPPDLVDQAVSSHCRPGAHLQNGLCDSPDLDRLQAFRTAAENRLSG